jgi:lipopolysaccharide export system protein LptC
MARGYGDSHSRAVVWAKIVLPLAALGLLSTLFLVSERIDPAEPIPYSDVEVAELAREPRLTAPQFAGVTQDGTALTASAAAARPDASNSADPAAEFGASASDLRVQLQTAAGFSADITAGSGRFDPAAGQMTLAGTVAIRTSTGYSIETAALEISTDRTRMSAAQAVAVIAPFGKLDAGSMLMQSTTSEAPHVLVFNDGVKLIYLPGK